MIDVFLPRFKLSIVFLKFSEIDSTLVIDANDFDISFDKGKLKGGCIYYSNLRAQDSIQVNAQLYKLDPGYFLGFMFQDSTLNGDATFLDTKASTHITFSKTGIDEMFENISVTINELVYEFPNDTLKGDALYINVDNLFYDKDTVPRPLSSLSAGINLDIGKLSSKGLYLSQFSSKISIKDGEFDMFINKNQSLFTNGEGRIIYAPFNEMPYFKISYGATGFKFDQLFERLNRKPVVDGNLKVQLAIEGKGKDWEQMSRSIQGNILLEGKDLKMKGFNLDKFTAKFRRSQNFNLLDLGAVVLAGPLGLLVTKGSDLTRLLINNKNDSTEIIQLRTELRIESGLLKLQDVAFSTAENLFALRGGYDLPTDSLGLIIAVLDKDGDVKVQQLVSGTGRYPKLSDIGPISTLLKPVGNLFNDLLPPEDADFYNGKVSHPKAKK